MLFVTSIHCTITHEDDSQHTLFGLECTLMQQDHPQILHKHAPRAHDISGVVVSNAEARFGASAAQPGIWRHAADQHRNANSSTARGSPRANVVGITAAGSVLEGAASKAHLSPMHGTRAARELHPGSRMATQIKGVKTRT